MLDEVLDGGEVEHANEGMRGSNGSVVSESKHHRNHVVPVRGEEEDKPLTVTISLD